MADFEDLRKQIRFQLAQLGGENAHHEFEHICRHLARHRICSNIIPATGPVSAGGDQGRDFETFRSYLAEHPIGDDSWFVGLVSSAPLAFACSLQKAIATKIRADVASVASHGGPIEGVHYFCEQDLPIAARHSLQKWARESHNVELEVYDGKAIAELLADRETFWIAERYLGISPAAFPSTPADEGDWYPEAYGRWESIAEPRGVADLHDLIQGARRALADPSHRADLQFWIDRLRRIAEDDSDRLASHRAAAEVIALSMRGMKTLIECDPLIRGYFRDLEAFPDTLDLETASTTYNYTFAAWAMHVTRIEPAELSAWHGRLLTVASNYLAEGGLAEDRPNRYAELLELRGYLALAIDPSKREGPNVDAAFSFWKDLLRVVESAPLYRITRFADHLTQFVALFGDHPDFHELTGQCDVLVSARHGAFAAASKAHDRAEEFRKTGNTPRAIAELHRAKISWFAPETLRASFLCFLRISGWYRAIDLNFAAKYYALAAAFMAVMAEDGDLRKQFPQGLVLAAESDYEQGSWCAYLEMARIAERGARLSLPTPENEMPEFLQNLVLASALITAITERLVPERVDYVNEQTSGLGISELVQDLLPAARQSIAGENEIRDRVAAQLVGPPFADTGRTRVTVWSAYGTEWRVSCTNTFSATAVTEEFCAILQIFLADVHALDLHLLRTTVEIKIDVQDRAVPTLNSIPSNAGRSWSVTLPTNQTIQGFHDLQERVFAFGATILWEISLLPQVEFNEKLEVLFRGGLKSKTTVVRPHSELFRTFMSEERFVASRREDGPFLGGWHPRPNEALPWPAKDGRSYQRADSLDRVKRRYTRSLAALRYTLPRLRRTNQFQEAVSELRAGGWRDWHILMAVVNLTANLRLARKFGDAEQAVVSGEYGKAFREYLLEESPDEPMPSVGFYTADRLRESLGITYPTTLRQLGLEAHQVTPDFPALEDFLRHRYHYWEDDVDHDDPFATEAEAGA